MISNTIPSEANRTALDSGGALPKRRNPSTGSGANKAWIEQIDALYQRHSKEIWATFYSKFSDPELAADALQESFVRLLAQPADSIQRPLQWLRQVGINWMLDNYRKKSRIQILSIGDPESLSLQTEAVDTDLSEENRQRVRAALARLSETDRRVLVLRYGLDWSSKKIAVATDANPEAIDMRLVRARRALAKQLIPLKP